MSLRSRVFVISLAAVAAGVAVSAVRGPAASPKNGVMSRDQQIVHALNRLAFGPRPGDVERVRQMGLSAWIEQQLSPASIDDSAVETQLAQLPALRYTGQQAMLAFATDRKLNKKKLQGAAMPDSTGMRRGDSIEAVGELDAGKLLRACDSQRQLQEVLVDFWSNHFNEDVKKGAVRTLKLVDDRDAIRPYVLGRFRDLLGATAHSPAMLVYLDNALSTGPNTNARPARRAGRLRRLARRRRLNLLGFAPQRAAAALPPAGLASAALPAAPAKGKAKGRGGLNENYGREIMELHTLGVDGGYTQKDVIEVARCFTGWGYSRTTGQFVFTPRRHDNGPKTVLGHFIPAGGGIRDGETVLDILASQPATATHIARELCVRFVTDTPPPSLVQRVAAAFQQSGGDLKVTMRALIYSPEFWDRSAYRAKIKSPFEYAVSAIRALDGHFQAPDPTIPSGRRTLIADGASSRAKGAVAKRAGRRLPGSTLAQEIASMGEPMFAYEAPTGYPEDSHAWISSGGLLARFNFALDLTNDRVREVAVTPQALTQALARSIPHPDSHASAPSSPAVITRLVSSMVAGDIAPSTRRVLTEQSGDATRLEALILGSPEFQKR